MAAVDVETYLVADAAFVASLDGSLPISLAIQGDSSVGMTLSGSVPLSWAVQGDSSVGMTLSGSVPLSWAVQGDSTIYAAPMDFDVAVCAMSGGSEFTSVMLLRKPFVPGPVAGAPPPNPFPGLQVGRLPPMRTSRPTIATNPRRTRRPPEEPER
jgi:hypothetical protein